MTHDNGWDVSPSWQEVRAERDVLIAELRGYKRSYENIMAERDALAAHVERLRNLLKHPRPDESLVHRAIIETPVTSLTRLKAEWQAEALAKVKPKDLTTNNGDIRGHAEWLAGWNSCLAELRRQAEGGDS